MVNFSVKAKSRTDLGKGAIRRMRKTGQIPGIVYGGGKDPSTIELRHDDILHNLENESFCSTILELDIDNKKEQVVLKDIQRHPAKPKILHADFLRVNPKSEITMSVPIHYLNVEESEGVKIGGDVDVLFTEISIRCLAKDLPEAIEVDVQHLKIAESISLSQIKLPKDVSISSFVGMSKEEIIEHDQTIFAVQESRMSRTADNDEKEVNNSENSDNE